jgi:protein TonB
MVTHPIHMPAPALPQLDVVVLCEDQSVHAAFVRAMLDMPLSRQERRNPLEWFASLSFHAFFIGALLVAPLYFADAIDMKSFSQTFLVGPPPPAPPPRAAAISQPIVRSHAARFLQAGRLVAPTFIPKTIAIIKEQALPPDVVGGVVGGVPGGILGGQLGGVQRGIIGGAGSSAAAPVLAFPPPVNRIVRVGGRISPPRAISTPPPLYPALARTARAQGQVVIDAIINERGDVTEARAISGSGLLIPAALAAVIKWRYEPTLLNGEPVSIEMHVFVNFVLE